MEEAMSEIKTQQKTKHDVVLKSRKNIINGKKQIPKHSTSIYNQRIID